MHHLYGDEVIHVFWLYDVFPATIIFFTHNIQLEIQSFCCRETFYHDAEAIS